jgi:hypothetical protein
LLHFPIMSQRSGACGLAYAGPPANYGDRLHLCAPCFSADHAETLPELAQALVTANE